MEEQLPTPPASPINSKLLHTNLDDSDLADFQHKAGRVSSSDPPTPAPANQIYSDFMSINVTPVSPPSTSSSPLSNRSPNSTPSPSTGRGKLTSPSLTANCSSPQNSSTRSSRTGYSSKVSQNLQFIIDNYPIVHHDPSHEKFVFPEEGPSFPYMFGVSFYNILGLPESPLTTSDDIHQAYFNLRMYLPIHFSTSLSPFHPTDPLCLKFTPPIRSFNLHHSFTPTNSPFLLKTVHSPISHTFSPKYKTWLSQIHYTLTKPEARETYDRGRRTEWFLQERRDIEHWEEKRREERERLARIRRRVSGEWRRNSGDVGLKLNQGQERLDLALGKTRLRVNTGEDRISTNTTDAKNTTSAFRSIKEGKLNLNLKVRNWRVGVQRDNDRSVSHDVTTLELENDWANEKEKYQMGEEFEGMVGGEVVVGRRMGTGFELLGEDGDSWTSEGDGGDERKGEGEAEGKDGDEDKELLALETLSDIDGDEEVGKVMLDAIEGWRDGGRDKGAVVEGVENKNEGQGEEETWGSESALDINNDADTFKDNPSSLSQAQSPTPTTSSRADKSDSEPPSLSPYSSSPSSLSPDNLKPETEQLEHEQVHVIEPKKAQPEIEKVTHFDPNEPVKEIWEHDYEGPGDGGEFSIWSILFLFFTVFKILVGIDGGGDGGVWGRKGKAYKEIWEIDYCSDGDDVEDGDDSERSANNTEESKLKGKTKATSSSFFDSEFLVSLALYSVGFGGLLLWLSFV
jgi:hypothetical protein